MKLLRLQLGTTFRSLPTGFEVQFLRERDRDRFDEFHPYCLAGLNGSGKSNLLEVLAAIFYHIECIYLDYRPDDFESKFPDNLRAPGFNAKICDPDAFELEYLIPDRLDKRGNILATYKGQLVAHIQVIKREGERPVIRYKKAFSGSQELGEELNRQEVKEVLPAYILGYSSGHNETLSLPFFKMRFIAFDEYRDKFKKQDAYERPEGRLIYLDDQFSQVILLCHFLFPSEAVTRVFKETVNLEGFRCFRLIIRRFHRVELEKDSEGNAKTPELTSYLNDLIEKLISCSTTHQAIPRRDAGPRAEDLYLDYWLTEETRKAFQVHFSASVGTSPELNKAATALNLFHKLQTLLMLNAYKVDPETKRQLYESASLYLNETVPTPASHERIARFKDSRLIKPGVKDRVYLKSLSDGEHQLLHTIGLCLLFRHQPALFLLDEPETHLNPGWRASYISTLRAALEADEGTKRVMREVLLTSHSPFIISDCRPENVLIFEKKDGQIAQRRPDFNTFGASATLITREVFGRDETIGDLAKNELKEMVESIDAVNVDARTLVKKVDHQFGDSVEKTMAIGKILQASKTKEN